jgi:ADP-ribose pyrophosphatase YjhB (NUDIX family)
VKAEHKVKHSVAVVVRNPRDGAFLLVRRPDDPGDPLAGAWGFPAVTLAGGEGELSAVARAGRAKLGVGLRAGRKIGTRTGTQGGTSLTLSEYEAVITAGTPSVPQPGAGVTQYTAWRWSADPGDLAEAAARGSLCARVFLDDGASPGDGPGD